MGYIDGKSGEEKRESTYTDFRADIEHELGTSLAEVDLNSVFESTERERWIDLVCFVE